MNYKNSVVYQIYPKSFYDSNGDGIGDLPGVTAKLDYLKDLGVDYLWLTPFFVSPQRDNGYDVADYRHVDPMFGVDDDVDVLISEAKKRDMGIMLDMVFNHTSTEHEWFQKALAGDERYQKFYIFKDGTEDKLPTNWISKFGGPAWKYVPSLGKWYLHLFDETQADLNWENEEVRQELISILKFWKDKGISGFRFDVVNLISKGEFLDDTEGDGRRFYTDGPHVHEYLKEIVGAAGIEDMMTVGEMSSTSLENCVRYSGRKEGELRSCFHFQHLKVDYKDGDKWSLMPADLVQLEKLFQYWGEGMQAGDAWDALFWENHDQPRSVSRFGNENEYWDRSSKMLGGVIHLMRGTPYIYQGEEIGLPNAHFTSIQDYRDVESINYYNILMESGKSEQETLEILGERSRDNGRTPMLWDETELAGFTEGTPWLPLTKLRIPGGDAAAQCENPDSIRAFYQRLIQIRKGEQVISEGEISFENVGQGVISFVRTLGERRIQVFANFNGDVKQIQGEEGTVFLSNLGREGKVSKSIDLEPYELLAVSF